MDGKADDKDILKMVTTIKNTPMVFIVGYGRSGTSLLQELLNSHPHIVAPPEYCFIPYLYPRFGNKKNWTKKDVLDFVEALYYRPIFSIWLIDKAQLTRKLFEVMQYADYTFMCKMVFYMMLNGKQNVVLFCDKNPENSLLIETLLKIFPEAKFIHMVRDPRDNVSSQGRSFGKKNVYLIARCWKGYNKSIENMKTKMPSKFYTVLYEKLVTASEETLRSLCGFLSVNFNESMLENHFPDRLQSIRENKFFKRVKELHKELGNPINTSNIGKWKKEMSAENIAITELITGTLARNAYGYNVSNAVNNNKELSSLKLFNSWIYYNTWKIYIKLRYKSYRLNKMYYTRKMKSRPMGA